jgi:hypothetical protein
MSEFLQSLPPWAFRALAFALGILGAAIGGLLLARWLRKLAAKLPDRE